MKKVIMSCAFLAAVGITTQSYAQLQAEQNVTVTMDLQPILQLNMSGPDNIDFTFNTIPQYTSGIVRYGATQLTVNSTVDWDLYVVGTSSNGVNWDSLVTYGNRNTNATASLPISLLELHQYPSNPSSSHATGANVDYSHVFDIDTTTLARGKNSIYASATPYTEPTAAEKYIAGHASSSDFVAGGSYLTQTSSTSSYKYIIDYRILPGLPVVFPMAGLNDGTTQALNATNGAAYAQPGIYSMNVKYVLAENQ